MHFTYWLHAHYLLVACTLLTGCMHRQDGLSSRAMTELVMHWLVQKMLPTVLQAGRAALVAATRLRKNVALAARGSQLVACDL